MSLGTSNQIQALLDGGAYIKILNLLKFDVDQLLEKVFLTFGNIASESLTQTNFLRERGIFDSFLPFYKRMNTLKLSTLRMLVCATSHLTRRKNDFILPLIPFFKELLKHKDDQILSYLIWAIKNLTNYGIYFLNEQIIETGFIPEIIPLLFSGKGLILPVLTVIDNITDLNYDKSELMIHCGILKAISVLLKYPDKQIRRLLFLVISKIFSENLNIQHLINEGIVTNIFLIGMKENQILVKREFIRAFSYVVRESSFDQLEYFINLGVIDLFLQPTDDLELILNNLTGIRNVLDASMHYLNFEKVINKFEELGGIDYLETLENHDEKDISLQSKLILRKLFE